MEYILPSKVEMINLQSWERSIKTRALESKNLTDNLNGTQVSYLTVQGPLIYTILPSPGVGEAPVQMVVWW